MHCTALTIGCLSSILMVALPQMSEAADKAADQGAPQQTVSAEDLAKPPDGTISFEASQFRLILGGGAGEGVLDFQGKKDPFTMTAASVGGAGYTQVQGTGAVHFLKTVEDFGGTYSGIGVGAAAIAGKGASTFQNSKGVVVSVRSATDGVALNMGVSAVTVQLAKH